MYKENYLKSFLVLGAIRILLVMPILTFLFYKVLEVSEIQGITETTIISVLSKPLSLLLLFVVMIVSLFFIYCEVGYLFLLSRLQMSEERISFKQILILLGKKAFYFLSYQLLFFFVYFILILPIALFGLNPTTTQSLRVPHFITDELMKSSIGTFIYIFVLLLIFYISMKLLYTVPFFVLDQKMTIGQAMKKSWSRTKGQILKNTITFGLILIIHSFVIGIGILLFLLPVILAETKFIAAAPWVSGFMLTCIQWFLFMGYGMLQVVFTELILRFSNIISEQSSEKMVSHLFPKISGKYPIIVLILIFMIMGISNTGILSQIIYQPSTLIIAHRGDTANGVENTISSLKSAAEIGADFVEMDVQETKDQKFVVFHDYTLRRLANRSESISDLTLAELQEITVSSGSFSDKIPSLEEYIEVAKKEHVKLLIEIKLHGNESADMEKNLVELLQKEGVTRDYLVQGLNGETVKRVKELDPTIKTGYLVALNIGNLPEIEADFLVLEEFSFTTRLLEQAREQGKTVFVWTVNRENLMRKYLRLDIDGMITNYPQTALQLRANFDKEHTLTARIKALIE
ncbi:glycerophosphodiester phosphodiesterase [Enterococcus sp. 5H]|uniref:glycerophosphodiester phosphodiesterase n=1 Tax=Enterococcus sp. 5H TaxID=1229490 RepID=UPI00230230D7|nr:glycerophosphodiester phosphodiesterase [Enterococcus sp. 5H]